MQSTESNIEVRLDLDHVVARVKTWPARLIPEEAADLRAILAALAAETDRADRAEARLAEVWDEGVDATFYDPESLGNISWGDNPYRSEATA